MSQADIRWKLRFENYGSRAKGNYRTGSDIDLTLEGSGLGFDDLLKINGELDDLLLPDTIDLSLLHLIDDAGLQEHIQRGGAEILPSAGGGLAGIFHARLEMRTAREVGRGRWPSRGCLPRAARPTS